MEKPLSILILDDEIRIREAFKDLLSNFDFDLHLAGLPSEAFEILKTTEIDIVLLDIRMPEMDGLQVLSKIRKEYPDIEVIMVTGHGNMDVVIKSMRLGAFDFIAKPVRFIDLRRAIEKTRRYIEINSRLADAQLNNSLLSREIQANIGGEIIGDSPSLRNIIDQMHQVAQTDDTPVLITGESGTGKELVARGIHYLSSRKEKYFYAVNCSAIPDTLFESEFFGHTKGAFTNATEAKIGWFEIARNGTLFLDEIGELPINLQTKFTRVLEVKKISRIGSHTELDTDVRIISATNQDIEDMVHDNRFRTDLYFRLNTFHIHVPPLRERQEDIPILLEYFTKYFSDRMNKHIVNIDPGVFSMLAEYRFPGNVRELRNLVERAVITCIKSSLHLRNFSGLFSPKISESTENPEHKNLNLRDMEARYIRLALDRSNQNRAQVAKLLGISWQALDRRLRKYDILTN